MRAAKRVAQIQRELPEVYCVRNALRTPDGTLLISRFRHDYVYYQDKVSRRTYMVDGGLDYCRRSAHGDEVDESVFVGIDPHEVVRQVVEWGTRGPDGDQPLTFVRLVDMDTPHIEAVLRECHPYPGIRAAMEQELVYRERLT